MYISIGSIIIDDIVLPDGRTQMGAFGGGSTHAIVGMKVWADDVGISAWVGNNLPVEMEAELGQSFDLRGVVHRDLPSPRAWQLFEADGTRTEVFRTDMEAFIRNSPQPEEFPDAYWHAKGIHYQNDLTRFREWAEKFRANDCGPILWEPWGELAIPENRGMFREMMRLVDAVSPNLMEAQRLTGLHTPEEIAQALLDDGAKAVVLRMGAAGSLTADLSGQLIQVPAARVAHIVDVTGAGNAFCGGFLIGMAETGNLLQAAAMGAVSASFSLEQFGALYSFEGIRISAQARLAELLPRVKCKTC